MAISGHSCRLENTPRLFSLFPLVTLLPAGRGREPGGLH